MKPAEASLPSDTEVLVKLSSMHPSIWCRGLRGTGPDASVVLGPPRLVDACLRDGYARGGKYRWRWRSDENGQEFGFTGEVLEVTPHAKIVHTQIYDAGDLGFSVGASRRSSPSPSRRPTASQT